MDIHNIYIYISILFICVQISSNHVDVFFMHRGQEPGHCRRRPLTLARLKACEPPRALTAGAADTQRAVLFGVLTAGATNIAQAGLTRNLGHSGSASGPSKAVAGAARQTVPSRASRRRDNGPQTRERGDSEREATMNLNSAGVLVHRRSGPLTGRPGPATRPHHLDEGAVPSAARTGRTTTSQATLA